MKMSLIQANRNERRHDTWPHGICSILGKNSNYQITMIGGRVMKKKNPGSGRVQNLIQKTNIRNDVLLSLTQMIFYDQMQSMVCLIAYLSFLSFFFFFYIQEHLLHIFFNLFFIFPKSYIIGSAPKRAVSLFPLVFVLIFSNTFTWRITMFHT